jgi:perosamine synthetase
LIPRRTLPPAAPYQRWEDLWAGLQAVLSARRAGSDFEKEIRECFGVRHVLAVSSGRAALVLILRALRSLSTRREVIVPAYTCFAVVAAVRAAGLEVRPCDIERSTLGIDPRALEAALTADTLCVVPTHLFGIPSDVDEIRSRVAGRVPFVVENAAQAMGGMLRERPLGTLGDVGFFSLGRGKAITAGDGGVVLTNSPAIGAALNEQYLALGEPGGFDLWRDYLTALFTRALINPALFWFPAGLPFLRLGETILPKEIEVRRLSRVGRGLLRAWRSRLDEGNDQRRRTAEYFRRELEINWGNAGVIPYLRLPVLVEKPEVREKILMLARKRGLGVTPMYPCSIDALDGVPSSSGGYPRAAETARSLLTIPTHHILTEQDRARIVALFREAGFAASTVMDAHMARRSSFAHHEAP